MTYHTLSKIEWIDRFAHYMVEATDHRMSLGEALLLAGVEYDDWFDANPEAAVKRLMTHYESDNDEIDATWRTMILLKRVRAPGFKA